MKKFLFGSLCPFMLAAVSICVAQPATKPQYNPVIPDYVADPSVVAFNGVYYMYGTSDIDHGLGEMGPPVVWKSTDLVNWSYKGTLIPGMDFNKPYAFTNSKGVQKTGYFRYWAPGKVITKNKQYYLYATIVKPNDDLGTYLLLGDKPEGPFHFSNGTGVYFNQPEKAAEEAKPVAPDIDGDPFVDDDGQAYIYWRRRAAAKLSADWTTLSGPTVAVPTKRSGYSEGPFLFKRKGIYYYLYTLSGGSNYRYGYMMSKVGPLGPFVAPQGEDIIIKSDLAAGVWGAGHGNVLQIPGTDNYIFYYLEYGAGSTTRQVFANQLLFNNDGTIKPVRVDRQGIANLVKNKAPKGIIPTAATASSFKAEEIKKADVDTAIAKQSNIGGRSAGEGVVKVERTISYMPANAVDGLNGTFWMAEAQDGKPWLQVDLGAVKTVKSCEMFFLESPLGHAWKLEKSKDGSNWETVKSQDEPQVMSPHVAGKIGKARFLKLTILSGAAGVWEMKVY